MESSLKDLVVILGAGASLRCGLPSTEQLTTSAEAALVDKYVELHTQGPRGRNKHEIRTIAFGLLTKLREAYGETWNFEVLLHAVRHIAAIVAFEQRAISGLPKTATPVATIISTIKEEFREATRFADLNFAYIGMIRAIHAEVASCTTFANSDAQIAREKTWQFLRSCAERFRLTVIDLNYDTIVDESGVSFIDGFVQASSEVSYKVFDPAGWQERGPAEHRLLHLHGSILFGLRMDDQWHDPWEVARFDDPSMALKAVTLTGSAQTFIAGAEQGAYPLISGLDKAGNLTYNPRPFGHYFLAAANVLCRSSRLLVIGYGGRDPHVNTWIGEHTDIHGENRRAVAILPHNLQREGDRLRGENLLLRLAFGRERWDTRGHMKAGVWRLAAPRRLIGRAGPMMHVCDYAPDAYAEAAAILSHLDEI